jgi:hypothetical protein
MGRDYSYVCVERSCWQYHCPAPRLYLRVWSSDGILLTRESRNTRRKTYPSANLSPHIPHAISRVWTRTPVVKDRRLIAWAMAPPSSHSGNIFETLTFVDKTSPFTCTFPFNISLASRLLFTTAAWCEFPSEQRTRRKYNALTIKYLGRVISCSYSVVMPMYRVIQKSLLTCKTNTVSWYFSWLTYGYSTVQLVEGR